MTKEEFVDKISKLPGVGPKKAEALYDAGYTTLEKLQTATLEELQAAPGIGPKVAEAIRDGLADLETGAKGAIEVREAGAAKAAPKPKIVEKVYTVKIKAELSDELKHALIVRAERKSHEPAFRRNFWWYRKGLDSEVWRVSRGELSKQRRGFKYRPPRVKVGYGKPAMTRGLHPSGFEEILVANPGELEQIDPKTQAARIVGTVGGRKRELIEKAAAEKKIRVLNPRRT